MKKFLVSLVAVMVASSAIAACYGDGNQCGKKKYRIIHITANNSEQMYGDSYLGRTDTTPEPERVYQVEQESTKTVARADDDKNAYVGARLDLNLLNFKTKYSATPATAIVDPNADSDSYKFEPVFGGNIFVGRNFSRAWRGDLEFGYMSKFTDSDEGITLSLSTLYLLGNVYYNFDGGIYLGAGVGAAFPNVKMDWTYFESGNSSTTNTSFMGAAMLGYSHRLSDNVVLDLRYRLAAFDGPEIKRNVEGYQVVGYDPLETLKTDIKTVWDNSFSIGIRYEF